jgi:uncharacterized membrane protein
MKKVFHFSSKSLISFLVFVIVAAALYFWLFSPAKAGRTVVDFSSVSGQSAAVGAGAIQNKVKAIKEKKSILPNVSVERITKEVVRRTTTGAAVGAGIGSVVPVLGTAVGGIVGAGTGYITSLFIDHIGDIPVTNSFVVDQVVDAINDPKSLPYYQTGQAVNDYSVDKIKNTFSDIQQSIVNPVGYVQEQITDVGEVVETAWDDTEDLWEDSWDATEDLFNW